MKTSPLLVLVFVMLTSACAGTASSDASQAATDERLCDALYRVYTDADNELATTRALGRLVDRGCIDAPPGYEANERALSDDPLGPSAIDENYPPADMRHPRSPSGIP